MKGCVFREIQNTVKIFRLQTLKSIYISAGYPANTGKTG